MTFQIAALPQNKPPTHTPSNSDQRFFLLCTGFLSFNTTWCLMMAGRLETKLSMFVFAFGLVSPSLRQPLALTSALS